MKKLRLISLVLLMCISFSVFVPTASAVEEPHLKSADECLLVDISTGKPLYSITPDQNHSIASLTKIMTVLIAVEQVENGNVSLDEMVTATSNVRRGLDVSSSNADITEGEQMSYKDLMYCALVHSANDACNVLAEYIAGDIQQFIVLMNNRAKEIGCTNTQFNDTCGMLNRSDGHYSCANDLYLITMEAMKHSLFYQIASTVDYTVPATNKHEQREIHNSNALMSENGLYGSGYLYEGVVGVKTGFTKPAGYCLVSTCEKNGLHLFCVVMGCNGPLTYTAVPGEYQNFIDSATLYDWAYSNFAYKTIFLSGERLKRFPVQNAKEDATVAVAPDQNLDLLLAKDISDNSIHVEINVDESKLVAPINEGDILGTVDVIISGEKYASCNAVAATSVELEKKAEIKQNISSFFSSRGFKIAVISIVSLLALAILAFSFIKYRRRKMLQAKIRAREIKRAQQMNKTRLSQSQYREPSNGQNSYRNDVPRRSQTRIQYVDEDEYDIEDEFETDSTYYQHTTIKPNSQKPSSHQISSQTQYRNSNTLPENNKLDEKKTIANESKKWEEADLDDVLRSLGIDPDDLN